MLAIFVKKIFRIQKLFVNCMTFSGPIENAFFLQQVWCAQKYLAPYVSEESLNLVVVIRNVCYASVTVI